MKKTLRLLEILFATLIFLFVTSCAFSNNTNEDKVVDFTLWSEIISDTNSALSNENGDLNLLFTRVDQITIDAENDDRDVEYDTSINCNVFNNVFRINENGDILYLAKDETKNSYFIYSEAGEKVFVGSSVHLNGFSRSYIDPYNFIVDIFDEKIMECFDLNDGKYVLDNKQYQKLMKSVQEDSYEEFKKNDILEIEITVESGLVTEFYYYLCVNETIQVTSLAGEKKEQYNAQITRKVHALYKWGDAEEIIIQ